VGRSPAKPREEFLRADGFTPFHAGYRLEQFALFLWSGFEALLIAVRNDRQLGAMQARP